MAQQIREITVTVRVGGPVEAEEIAKLMQDAAANRQPGRYFQPRGWAVKDVVLK